MHARAIVLRSVTSANQKFYFYLSLFAPRLLVLFALLHVSHVRQHTGTATYFGSHSIHDALEAVGCDASAHAVLDFIASHCASSTRISFLEFATAFARLHPKGPRAPALRCVEALELRYT